MKGPCVVLLVISLLLDSEEDFDNIPDPLTDEELDMLDTADNPTPT